MRISFDFKTQDIHISQDGLQPFGATLSAVFERHGMTVDLRGHKFRFDVTADGTSILDLKLPHEGTSFHRTDQDALTAVRIHWQPGQAIAVHVDWEKGGESVARKTLTFTAPAQEDDDAPFPDDTAEDDAPVG